MLIPADDYHDNVCRGDIVNSETECPDGVVDVFDLLALLADWNCRIGGLPSALTLEDEVLNAGLTMNDWDEFEDKMMNGTAAEKRNYNCWMKRYLTGCVVCPPCRGPDPF